MNNMNPMLCLEEIKNTLENGSYKEYLQAMRDFKDKKISILRVIAKLRGLFAGHPNLIKGLNTILPTTYQIVLPEEDAVGFVEKVKTVFCSDQRVFTAFLGILKKYENGNKSIIEVYKEVAVLFHGHPELLLGFRDFLPDTSTKRKVSPAPDHVLPSQKKRKIEKKSVVAEKEKIICSTQDEFFGRLKANISDADVHEKVEKSLQLYDLEVVNRVELLKVLAYYVPEQINWIDEFLEKSEKRLDLSKFEHITPSYSRVLPKPKKFEEEDRKRRSRDPKRWSRLSSTERSCNLNDEWKCKAVREDPFIHRSIDPYEERLFACEDDMFEIDLGMRPVNQAVECTEDLLQRLEVKQKEGENMQKGKRIGNFEDYFSVPTLKYIEKLCGKKVLASLRSNIREVLPYVLERLKVKQKEGIEARAKVAVDMCKYDKVHKKYLKENAKGDESQRPNYKVNLGLV